MIPRRDFGGSPPRMLSAIFSRSDRLFFSPKLESRIFSRDLRTRERAQLAPLSFRSARPLGPIFFANFGFFRDKPFLV